MRAGRPYRCTGTIAFVLGVTTASMASGSMLALWRSQSAKIGKAPTLDTAIAVGIAVLAGTITSSPGPMPYARNRSSSAVVPELTPMAKRVPQYCAHSRSKVSTNGPFTYTPRENTSWIAASISGWISAYWRPRSNKRIWLIVCEVTVRSLPFPFVGAPADFGAVRARGVGIVVTGSPGRKLAFAAFERAGRDLVEHEPFAAQHEGVPHARRQTQVERRLRIAAGADLEHALERAVLRQQRETRRAFDRVKRLTAFEMAHRPKIGVAVLDDEHLVQTVLRRRMRA